MKNIILIAVTAAILATSALAEDGDLSEELVARAKLLKAQMWDNSRQKSCTSYSGMPGTILDGRRNNQLPMSTYVSFMEKTISKGKLTQKMADYRMRMVFSAYESPLYSDDKLHDRVKAELRDQFFMQCYSNYAELSGLSRE